MRDLGNDHTFHIASFLPLSLHSNLPRVKIPFSMSLSVSPKLSSVTGSVALSFMIPLSLLKTLSSASQLQYPSEPAQPAMKIRTDVKKEHEIMTDKTDGTNA